MRTLLHLASKDLFYRWNLALMMSLLIGVAFTVYLVTLNLSRAVNEQVMREAPGWLVVESGTGMGEVYGSRLSPSTGEALRQRGLSQVIPEIHDVAATSGADATLLRGVDPTLVEQLEKPIFVQGRPLQPGDPPRLAVIGYRLAENRRIGLNQTIELRGRLFTVVGIFTVGTYADNEAWISLSDAQALLNYDQDVSIYVIPDEGKLRAGEELGGGIRVLHKGEGSRFLGSEITNLLNFLHLVAQTMGVATAFTLTQALWRLAWLRRRQFGILRSLGFRRSVLVIYLLIQASWITLGGIVSGLFFYNGINLLIIQKLMVFGFSVRLTWDPENLMFAAGWALGILGIGVLLPAIGLNQQNIMTLIRSE